MYYTTLKKLRNNNACDERYNYLVENGNFTDDSKISLREILDINGIQDAIWALRTIKAKKDTVLFACDCAESTITIFEGRYPDNKRPRIAIEKAREYIKNPNKTNKKAAAAASYAAAYAAADAADAADADYAAAYAAADAAAAAYAAANAAAYAADAARAAADAARAAAYAARAAAEAADAAVCAAYAADADYAAKREKQKKLFIKYFCR